MWNCKEKSRLRKPPYYTLRWILLSFLLRAWSVLLTSSVSVATMAMQPRLVELWKCRVQHLRQFYCSQKQDQKVKEHPVMSSNVWYVPALLTGWLMAMSCIVLLALLVNVTYAMDKGNFYRQRDPLWVRSMRWGFHICGISKDVLDFLTQVFFVGS